VTFKYLLDYLYTNHMTYKEYLASEHWRDVKDRFMKSKFRKKCFVCGSKNKLNLHHKTYIRVGNEYLTDLCLLCEECHKKVHEREKPTRGTNRNGKVLWGAASVLRRKHIKSLRCKAILYTGRHCRKRAINGQFYCKEHIPKH
jgi:5-methylcytosine-specific restriction endonuclease McrA